MVVNWTVTDHPEVLEVLQWEACCKALLEVKELVPMALRGVQDPTPLKRDPGAKWSEVTILDKTLPMRQYLEDARSLFPRTMAGKGMGLVLKAVVKEVSGRQAGVVRWRKLQESG